MGSLMTIMRLPLASSGAISPRRAVLIAAVVSSSVAVVRTATSKPAKPAEDVVSVAWQPISSGVRSRISSAALRKILRFSV